MLVSLWANQGKEPKQSITPFFFFFASLKLLGWIFTHKYFFRYLRHKLTFSLLISAHLDPLNLSVGIYAKIQKNNTEFLQYIHSRMYLREIWKHLLRLSIFSFSICFSSSIGSISPSSVKFYSVVSIPNMMSWL